MQCLEKDCGTCAHCADKLRFGGKGVKKQASQQYVLLLEERPDQERPDLASLLSWER